MSDRRSNLLRQTRSRVIVQGLFANKVLKAIPSLSACAEVAAEGVDPGLVIVCILFSEERSIGEEADLSLVYLLGFGPRNWQRPRMQRVGELCA